MSSLNHKNGTQVGRLSIVAMITLLSLNSGPNSTSGLALAQQPMVSGTALFSGLAAALPNVRSGQTATQLADGRWLILGGSRDSANAKAQMVNINGKITTLPATMTEARTEHSATLMPDGTVWILGGIDAQGRVVSTAERFDPSTGAFTVLGDLGLLARAKHSANVLADGRLLVVGGVDKRGEVLSLAEIYDPQTQQATQVSSSLQAARAQQTSGLLPNHEVLFWGGVDAGGHMVDSAEAYDPAAQRFVAVGAQELKVFAQSLTGGSPALQDSTPSAAATNVAVDQPLIVRFSKRMAVASLNNATVTLVGPAGAVAVKPVALEGGVLLFVTPTQQLRPDASYTLFVQGATDEFGKLLPPTVIGFKTAALNQGKAKAAAAGSVANAMLSTPGQMRAPIGNSGQGQDDDEDADEVWTPGEGNFHGHWLSGQRHLSRKNKPQHEELRRVLHGDDTFAKLTPADVARKKLPATRHMAPSGVTAVAGQVLKLNGNPLANVTLSIGKHSVKTDRNGEFLLSGLPSGQQTLVIDAETADRGRSHYGRYEYLVDIKAGDTNVLPFVIWMSRLDTQDAVQIASPTKIETVLTNPHIPGLELHIPPGTVIRDISGKVVTELTMTAIPVDQPPFPLPNIPVPVYFTVQPGGAHLEGIDAKSAKGARLIYPNYTGSAPGTRFTFWNYDSAKRGWFAYGEGTVSADGKQIVPDEGVVIYEFTGAMVGSPGNGPGGGPGSGGGNGSGGGGDGPGGGNGSGGGGGDGSGGGGDGSGGGGDGSGGGGDGSGGGGDGSGGGGDGSGNGGGGSEGGGNSCGSAGDPVDLYSGLFVSNNQDFYIPDIVPIKIGRTYRPADDQSRAFGIGTNLSYDIFVVGSTNPWTYQDLILPDGARVHFDRISAGTSYTDAVYRSNTSNGEYYGAIIKWDSGYPGSAWSLTKKDGTVFYFPEAMNSPSARAGAVIGIKDRFGNITQLKRDSYANLTQIIGPSGRKLVLTYDTSNRITQITDDIGRQMSYGYDTSGRLATVTDPDGKVKQYTYAAMTVSASQSIGGVTKTTNMLTITDKLNRVAVTNEYDVNGRVSKQTLADGRTFLFAYTLSPYTNPTTGVTTQVSTQTDVTDERGTVTRYEFNAFNGKPSRITEALGRPEQRVTTYNWNTTTKLLDSVVDPLGRTTTYTYDALGNMTGSTALSGTAQAVTTSATYDATYSRLTSAINGLGNAFNYTYNSLGALTQASTPMGQTINFDRDGFGRVTAVRDQLSQGVQLSYSGADVSSVTDTLGNATSSFTDAVGRVRAVRDPLGNASFFSYDVMNRPKLATNPQGNTIQRTFDAKGNVLTQTDEKGNTTSYTYDSRNRLASKKDALLNSVTYGYEPGGQINRIVDRKGQLTGITYDALGRVTQIGYGATVAAPTAFQSTVSYTWDAGDRLTQVVDSVSGTITRSYDGLDRVLSETTPQGSVNYTYDAAGRRSSMTVQGQPTVSYTWDAANRLTTIQQAAGASNPARNIQFAYDSLGRRQMTTYANGITATYAYDAMSRVSSITYKKTGGVLLGDLTYTYDEAGKLITKGGSLWSQQQGTEAASTAFNVNNQETAWNGKTLSYDANGNLTSDGTNTYTWDARNRLTAISGGVTASFQYDAFGRRIGKTVSGVTTGYVYDGANFVQEKADTSGASAVTANLLAGPGMDEVFLRDGNGVAATVLTDIQGSAVLATDAAQATVATYTYDAYGNTTQTGTNANTQQYTGRENDKTGLYYYRARYYHPAVGRFIAEDPIGWQSGQTNAYAYVGGNPISYTDPSGLCPMCLIPALPYVGEALVIGATWWASQQAKTPNTGEPDSWHTNPGSGQERKYGPNGKPEYDIDWDHDHGQGSPHGHNWDNGKRDNGWPISPWPKDRKPKCGG